MKAKDYVNHYIESPTIENLRLIMTQFLEEAAELEASRQIKTSEGIFALFNECDQKWRTFCRLVDECTHKPIPVRPSAEGFSNLLKEINPTEYTSWQMNKQLKKHTQNRRLGGRQRL